MKAYAVRYKDDQRFDLIVFAETRSKAKFHAANLIAENYFASSGTLKKCLIGMNAVRAPKADSLYNGSKTMALERQSIYEYR